MKIRILIVEDHHIFRMGLIELINHEPDLEVCGEADNEGDAWHLVQELNPALVIVDISLKGSNGLNLIKRIHEFNEEIQVIVLSMHDEALYAERSIMAGAKGYIMKQETSSTVIKAIRRVLAGKLHVSEQLMDSMLATLRGNLAPTYNSPADALTNRELEVFRLIGLGMSTKDIAQNLDLGIKTIGTYRERIKEKLDLKNANELIKSAVHWVSNN